MVSQYYYSFNWNNLVWFWESPQKSTAGIADTSNNLSLSSMELPQQSATAWKMSRGMSPVYTEKEKNNPQVYFDIYAFLLYIDSSTLINFLCTGHKSFVSHWCSKLNDIGLSVVWSTFWIYFFSIYYLAASREI